jgi:predicted transcriptional regulator
MQRMGQSEGSKRAELLLLFSRGAKSRLCILNTLVNKPKNCNQIAKEIGLGWWTVQKHLKRMETEKFVMCEDFGQMKFYSLTSRGVAALSLCLKQKKDQ